MPGTLFIGGTQHGERFTVPDDQDEAQVGAEGVLAEPGTTGETESYFRAELPKGSAEPSVFIHECEDWTAEQILEVIADD